MNDLTGKQIDVYTIELTVGTGSTGTVYRARDEQSQINVALKLISTGLVNNPEFHKYILNNAPRLKQLKHQTIAQLYEVGETQEQLYLATEWVQGESLGQFWQHQPLWSLKMAGRLIENVAGGLAFAHRQGVVHGGLQPNNILLKPYGGDLPWQPVLTDFMLSGFLPGEPPDSLLPYLSPEQCEGRKANGRSDIYAVGIILYQLATGKLPHAPHTTADVLSAGPLPAPRTLRPDMPASLDSIIRKATARKPGERYRSMEEFLLTLRREVPRLPDDTPGQNPVSPPPSPQPAIPPPPPAPAAPPPLPEPAISSDADFLIISHANEPDQTFSLEKWLITIGQIAGNDLILKGDGVAGKHARLERSDTGWNIVDMGSLNGTFLNGSPLLPDVPEPWKPGQVVRIGSYQLQWQSGIAAEAAAPKYTPPPAVEPPAPAKERLYINLKPAQLQAVPGSPASATLEVDNQTNRRVTMTLESSGIPAGWAAMETSPFTLGPRQRITVPIALQPPRKAQATTGPHPFQISVRPENSVVETAVCQGQLTILPFTQFFVEIRPSTLQHGQTGELIFHNEGNRPGQYALKPSDVANALAFDLSPTTPEVPPGESYALPFRIDVRQRPFFIQRKIIPYELRVTDHDVERVEKRRVIATPYLSLPALLLILVPLLLISLFAGRTILCRDEYNAEAASWICPQTPEAELPSAKPTNMPGNIAVAGVTVMPTATPTISPVESPTAVATPQTESAFTPQSIGNSVNGKPIEALKFGNGPTSILFVGGIHAGNSISLAQQIAQQLRGAPESIPDNVTVYIVPNLNPDSASNGNRLNANGVDLNRNWNCNWDKMDNGHRGSKRLSEPETQALNEFIQGIQPVAAVFWDTPSKPSNQGIVSLGRCGSGQADFSRELAAAYADALDSYSPDQADDSQSVSGDATDSLAEMGIPAVYVLLNDADADDGSVHMDGVVAVLNQFANTSSP